MRIGIIGAENSHTAAIAKTLNISHDVPGFEVTHVWGETAEFAAKAAAEGQIPNVVAEYTEMIGQVEAVLVDHRHGQYHLEAARPFVEAGLPVFVDKPLTTDLAEGVAFVRLAKKRRVPITSYSVLSLQQSSLAFAEEMKGLGTLRSLVTAGPVDIDSQYGGVFFYAVHQVDLICSLVEATPISVSTVREGNDGIATITFDSGAFAVVHCLKDSWSAGFLASAYGSQKAAHATLKFDENPYLAGIQRFCRMFETKVEPAPPATYLRPVAVLEAMQKSFATKRPAKVKKVPKL
jgi:predicted dehydrogenase